jgi:hypothetical protein
MSERQKLFLAILASVFFHLALGYVLASRTDRHSIEMEKPRPDLSQLTVTIMPQKPAAPVAKGAPLLAPAPTPQQMMPVLDSDGLTRASKAPLHPVFQSDSNMAAGSLLPATGNIPLPTQREASRKFMDFANQPASVGKGQTPAEAVHGRPAKLAQPAQSMQVQTPYAVTQVQQSPTPAPQEQATPTPKPVPTPGPDVLALGTPTPTPAPASKLPTPTEELARLTVPPPPMRAHADMAPMTHPEEAAPPAPPSPPTPSQPEPSTQLQTEKTRIDGGITAHGPEGVDAIETPFGRYHRKLSNLIGSRWQLYLQEHPKDVGDVTILVKLDTDGKVAATRVITNHSMDDLAELSTRAIMESDLPPVPDDLAPMLRDGKLEITFNFNVYDPNNESPDR